MQAGANSMAMETSQFNKQNFYPKHLDEDEINDPLIVIRDFFSADWLPGHLGGLQEWRKYVIEEGYYKDHTKSPASLLYTYRLNVQLVEAVYLLSKTKRAIKLAQSVNINFDEQLQQEEKEWLHYPVYLSSVELINPYLAISNLFKAYTIEQYRDFLYEWLETGLSAGVADETLNASDIIYFYENMQKLYEAAWIIRQRELEPTLKSKLEKAEELARIAQKQTAGMSILKLNCTFNNSLTYAERLGLGELVKIICDEIPSVQLIVHLGTHNDPDTFYLLIVTDEKEKTSEHEIVNKIEDKCKLLINVCAIVHKSDAFIKAIEGGGRFFTNALRAAKIAYHSTDLMIPETQPIDNQAVRLKAEAHWKRWGRQGKEFLNAAVHCYDEGNYNLSVFLLHQSVESTLSAIIRVNLGYRLSSHNLSRMIRLTLIFTDDLKNIFDFSSADGAQLFNLLQTAYSAARYKNDFNADNEVVKALSDKVCKISITAERLYEQAMDCLKD
jgi:HEPN domain-containing protein